MATNDPTSIENPSGNDELNSEIKKFETSRSHDSTSRTRFPDSLNLSSTQSAIKHNSNFDEIIAVYAENSSKSLLQNRVYKSVYFWFSIILLFLFALKILYGVQEGTSSEANLTAIVSFVTSFIVLPVTITKYLFNPKETHDLNKIVQSIQTHDREMTHFPFK